MKIKIRLKKDMEISQPMATQPWEFGYFVDSIAAGQLPAPRAVIITEHGEFELVPFYSIKAINEKKNRMDKLLRKIGKNDFFKLHEETTMNPQPKQKRLILSKTDWIRQIKRMFSECGYACQVCGKVYYPEENCLAPHHIKTRGAGGGNDPKNIMIVCKECHFKIHSGEVEI